MSLRDWKPSNWEKVKKGLIEDFFGSYPKTEDEKVEIVREAVLLELEKRSIRLEHSCNPSILGYKVKDPTLVIEPPMYLINLGEPIK